MNRRSPTDADVAASSISRALAVLDCFSRTRSTLTLSQIARALNRPVSSTDRHLRQLLAWGAVDRTEDGRYTIGLRLWETGLLAPRSTELRHTALPFLEDLYEVTHQNVQLAVLDGDETVYVERIFSHDATPILARPGFRLSALVTGVGRVLVAYADAEVRENILNSPVPRMTPRTLDNPEQLRAELATVRLQGYAVSERQVEMVSTSIAAPVTQGVGGEVVAAMSIIAPFQDGAVERFLPAVLTCARGISRAWGAHSSGTGTSDA